MGTYLLFSIFLTIVKDNHIVYIGGFDLPDNNAAAQRVLANAKLFRDVP